MSTLLDVAPMNDHRLTEGGVATMILSGHHRMAVALAPTVNPACAADMGMTGMPADGRCRRRVVVAVTAGRGRRGRGARVMVMHPGQRPGRRESRKD